MAIFANTFWILRSALKTLPFQPLHNQQPSSRTDPSPRTPLASLPYPAANYVVPHDVGRALPAHLPNPHHPVHRRRHQQANFPQVAETYPSSLPHPQPTRPVSRQSAQASLDFLLNRLAYPPPSPGTSLPQRPPPQDHRLTTSMRTQHQDRHLGTSNVRAHLQDLRSATKPREPPSQIGPRTQLGTRPRYA